MAQKVLSNIDTIDENMSDQLGKGVVPLKPRNESFLELAEEVLKQTDWNMARIDFTKAEIKNQMERIRTARQGYQHYPWEWTIVAFPL